MPSIWFRQLCSFARSALLAFVSRNSSGERQKERWQPRVLVCISVLCLVEPVDVYNSQPILSEASQTTDAHS